MLWIIEYDCVGDCGDCDVDDESLFMQLYGWFELRRTVYTLSTEERRSKNGIRYSSSVSDVSSNQLATGTALSCSKIHINYNMPIIIPNRFPISLKLTG